MSEIRTLDQALMELENELGQFRQLKPQLDRVAEEATAVVDKLRNDIKNIRDDAQEALGGVERAYSVLSDRNDEQFQELRSAWNEHFALAEKTVGGIQLLAETTNEAIDRIGEVTAKLMAVAKMISELNLPLRFDKLDASISSALAVSQSLQERFDRLVKEMDAHFDRAINQVVQRIELSEKKMLESTSETGQSLEDSINNRFDKHHRSVRLISIWLLILLVLGLLVNSAMLLYLIMFRS